MNNPLKLPKANSVVILLVNIILILSFADLSSSQVAELNSPTSKGKNEWVVFSPTNKSFTVELPKSPKQERKISIVSREKETDPTLYVFKCTKAVNIYLLPSNYKIQRNRVSIYETDVSKCKRRKNDFDKEVNTLFIFAGGDNQTLLSDKMVNINGMKGREIIYKNGSEIYARTLALDAGKRLFVVTYDRMNGDLAEEERIFRTFKPKFIR